MRRVVIGIMVLGALSVGLTAAPAGAAKPAVSVRDATCDVDGHVTISPGLAHTAPAQKFRFDLQLSCISTTAELTATMRLPSAGCTQPIFGLSGLITIAGADATTSSGKLSIQTNLLGETGNTSMKAKIRAGRFSGDHASAVAQMTADQTGSCSTTPITSLTVYAHRSAFLTPLIFKHPA